MHLTLTDADILAQVRDHFKAGPPTRIGVAVSGGGDSIALLHILHRCFNPDAVTLNAVTIDHGLRPEAADEARQVADFCESLGVTHSTLRWRGWDGTGNLQDQARRARYELLGDWARMHKVSVVALGHTADDQAETVLMRLGRAAGVTGLAAMPPRRTAHGVVLSRPMLSLTREQLRSYLRTHQLRWIDDPSNDDLQFDRIKARQALTVLEPLGITAQSLALVAGNMQQARDALDWYSFLAANDIAQVNGGDILLDHRHFRTLPEEIARRLISQAVTWIGGSEYAPRRSAMTTVLDAARSRKSATLNGCQVVHHGANIWICREFNAVRKTRCAVDRLWDGRWRLQGANIDGCELRPLGRRGLMHCAEWRGTGRPHASLTASPAVWRGDELVAAPLAGYPEGWSAHLSAGSEEFFAALLTH